jgi:hypothetical protein
MRNWSTSLDKFLRDNDLPVLTHAGLVAHEDAQAWADEQYETFAERRRREAEAAGEARYLEDLRSSTKSLEETRDQLPARQMKRGRQRKRADDQE